ncbi:MAG TPA: M13 family metallopeptidase [Terriglobales bacterium]|nr:M13 family metallopeptidase [Terriglobales bacterium]
MRWQGLGWLILVCNLSNLVWSQAAGNLAPAGTPRALELSDMDPSVDPCVDFYRYACGGWMSRNPIPPDQSRWGRFNELQENNFKALRGILEQASAPDPARSETTQKLGDYYASCMDEARIESQGTKPIEPLLKAVDKISNKKDLLRTVALLHTNGVAALFVFAQAPDLHDATRSVANLDQGGLGLPDRDYYRNNDAKSVETRQRYLEHMQKMFELLGETPQAASANSKTVMEIETSLANASMDRAERRDPEKRDHWMKVEEISSAAPNFELLTYFQDTAAPEFSSLNVVNPDFFRTISPLIDSVPLEQWKAYLRWHVARTAAPLLSKRFVEEDFRFERQYLQGQKEMQLRWKQCVERTDRQVGQLLGRPYVDEYFGPQNKERTLQMVQMIETALAGDIKSLSWMSDTTKKQAQIKLDAIRNNIGYPDKWRDYSNLKIVRGEFAEDTLRANHFEFNRQLDKIGRAVDRTDWNMSPPTVNAYYRSAFNDITFPAGILQPPFYDAKLDDAMNYGGIGAVIGHELTHGFDDQGSQFDAQGNFKSWWTPEDRKEFENRTDCIVKEYEGFTVGDLHLRGKLTLGENTADNGGLRIAYLALEDQLKDKDVPKMDGFTPQQRFFLGYARIWCQNITPEAARVRVYTDPHSPGQYRVNGVISNMPEFQKAFGCKVGQPMVRQNACRVW